MDKSSNTPASATAAALTSFCFFLYHPVNAGTAEVPFALGLVVSLVCGLRITHWKMLPKNGGVWTSYFVARYSAPFEGVAGMAAIAK